MYSKIKNIQIIISLMKQHNIRHIVLSAGTRHVPIAHSVENDPFFKCYSVVDERSAGYYALGIAKETGECVAIACTSSTATCNYTPAIAEAFYQKVPILVLTGDRDPYRLGQLEDQMIDQVDMYKNFCKKCVSLPIVNNEYDEWYCSRLVNEAILELNHHGCGPVQINFPIVQSIDDIADASVEELPVYPKITRVDVESHNNVWADYAKNLSSYRRIMVVCGSGDPASGSQISAMRAFFSSFNCVFATEKVANINFEGSIDTYLVAEAITGEVVRSHIKPDLVIFFGGNFISRWKTMLRGQKNTFSSWIIVPDGIVMDPFQNLSTVFECSPEYFFSRMASLVKNGKNDKRLFDDLKKIKDSIDLPAMNDIKKTVNGFAIADARFKKLPAPTESELISDEYVSSFSAINALSKRIPKHSLVALSILNSVRIMQMFSLNEDINVYSNIGTDGIDGCMSTFLGQSAVSDRECYLVVGDLSFFYDMNSASIRNIKNNVHIMMINNGGGAEFYYSMGPQKLPNIDTHISAAHQHSAKEWVEACGFTYYSASTQEEFDRIIDRFAAPSDNPVFFEIFTNKLKDVNMLKGYVRSIRQDTPARAFAKSVEKNAPPVVRQLLQTAPGTAIREKLKKYIK